MDDSSYSPAYEELGPTRRLTCSAEPRPNSQPSAAIQNLIGQLGLRYRPSVQADLEAHAGTLALLACDVADLDPRDLDEAIRRHVKRSPFMPKACELIGLAEDARRNREYRCSPAVRAIDFQNPPPPSPIIPCTAEQADEIMREFGLKANPATDPGQFVQTTPQGGA